MNQTAALTKIKRGARTHIIRCCLDSVYPHLIEIGSDCILVDTTLICHDAPSRVIDGRGAIGRIVIGDNVAICTGAIVLYGAVIGSGSIVGAGAVMTPGTVIPSGEFWGGCPARRIGTALEFARRREAFFAAQQTVDDWRTLQPGQVYYRKLDGDDLIPWTRKPLDSPT